MKNGVRSVHGVKNVLLCHNVTRNNIFTDVQFGFRKRCSVRLLLTIQDLTSSIDCKGQVGVICTCNVHSRRGV